MTPPFHSFAPAAAVLLCLLAGALAAAPFRKPAARPEAAKWTLKFTENFDGPRPNPKMWRRIEGSPDAGADWLKNISTRPDLVETRNGVLILKGVRNDDPSADSRRVLAGGLSTKGLFNMKYGKIEARIRFSPQKGAWPAVWLMPESPVGSWPLCGEIDVLERLNSDPFVYQTVHSAWTQAHPGDPPRGRTAAIKQDDWNVYAMEWTPSRIVWRVNGKQTHRYDKVDDSRERWPWDVPFYLMIDMQLGGKWVGPVDESTLPVEMEVDWVKFYQLSSGTKRISEFTRPKK